MNEEGNGEDYYYLLNRNTRSGNRQYHESNLQGKYARQVYFNYTFQ